MDRAIPIARKLVPGDRVPPVGIKPTVCESGDFGQGIELNAVSERDKRGSGNDDEEQDPPHTPRSHKKPTDTPS